MGFKFAQVGLFVALCISSAALQATEYRVGQLWTFDADDTQTKSRVLINKIDSDARLGDIFHVSVLNINLPNPLVEGAVQQHLPHFPVSRETLDKSLLELQETGEIHAEFKSGYALWKEAFDKQQAGVFDISIKEIVAIMEDAINKQAAVTPNTE